MLAVEDNPLVVLHEGKLSAIHICFGPLADLRDAEIRVLRSRQSPMYGNPRFRWKGRFTYEDILLEATLRGLLFHCMFEQLCHGRHQVTAVYRVHR